MNDDSPVRRRYHLMTPLGPLADTFPAGTAFVGRRHSKDQYLVHYEKPGNVSNIVTFEDRIRHAAGRLDEDYPTSKMMAGTEKIFRIVGTVMRNDEIGWHIDEITDRAALEEWADGPHYEGGSPHLHEEGRIRRFNQKMRKGAKQ